MSLLHVGDVGGGGASAFVFALPLPETFALHETFGVFRVYPYVYDFVRLVGCTWSAESFT